MIRLYGKAPYETALIHGGPGGVGSLSYVAERLSSTKRGIMEPIQSKLSIAELIQELHEQLSKHATFPVNLVGHSWGAWLSLLYAGRFPEKVKRLVLIGCPPFREKEAFLILARRLARLDPKEALELESLISTSCGIPPGAMEKLQFLMRKADDYCPMEIPAARGVEVLPPDEEAFEAVWPQAAKMRLNGEWEILLSKIKCPISIIHGEEDPHPWPGVTAPLRDNYANADNAEIYLIPRCGHSPFREKYAMSSFYKIMEKILS